MAVKTLMKRKQLEAAQRKMAEYQRREAELQQAIDTADAISPDLENQVNELSQNMESTQASIDTLTQELAELEDASGNPEPDVPDGNPEPNVRSGRTGAPSAQRSAPVSSGFVCRSQCFSSRSARDSFYTRTEVKDFLARVRSGISSKRSVSGAELQIPTVMLEVLRDNLNKYSKLITKVRLRPVKGHARQNVIGEVPEGVWMEMTGALNNLEFSLTQLEVDGYKVGGVIAIDNYLLADTDINLGEEIMYMLGQSIGLAVDKGIVFGKGSGSKMPVGLVTRLAQTAQPSYWGANQGEWIDLSSSNVLKLDLANATGVDFFTTLLRALGKAKAKFSSSERVWIMNETTKMDLLVRALGTNSAAAIVSGMGNTMPIIGGEIITLEFMPDYQIAGGYLDKFLLVEREGGSLAVSDQAMFVEDKTVYKGTARYDGQPVRGECFVVVRYDNTAVTTSIEFAADYANTALNALVVTSAAGATAGTTKLTVAGMVSSSNKLAAIVSGAPVSVEAGKKPGAGWTTIVSGTTELEATSGVGVTVVELDKAGKIISVAYVSSVTSKAAA